MLKGVLMPKRSVTPDNGSKCSACLSEGLPLDDRLQDYSPLSRR